MKKKFAFALAATALATAAMAQNGPLAQIRSVNGAVTITQNNQVVNAAPGTALQAGTSVTAGSSGNAVIAFNNGCVLELKPNQTVVISETVCVAGAGAGGGGGAGGAQVAGYVAGGLVGLYTVSELLDDDTKPQPQPPQEQPPAPQPEKPGSKPKPKPPISGS
jgi:hypothetical protein